MFHVAIVGTGRVGSAIAYTLLWERYIDEISLADTAPKVAEITKEELSHAISSHGYDVKINAYDHSKYIQDADLIIISAGFPRTPDMSRRDLAGKNATIIRDIIESTIDNNPNAWYFVITNPVDAMTTLANSIADGKRPVIGTGTNLETSRFRIILSRELKVPIHLVEAYVGGEHGRAAVFLWSLVKVDGMPLEDYLNKSGISFNKTKCKNYVLEISKEIIRVKGGTRYGPAGSFIEIIRGILLNTGKIVSYSRPMNFDDIPEPVYVTVPARISRSRSIDLWNVLSKYEKEEIHEAAKVIYETYKKSKIAAGI